MSTVIFDRGILVTGATGFIGTALCCRLIANGNVIKRVLPDATSKLDGRANTGIIDGAYFTDLLREIDCIVHLAARTHVLQETAADPLSEYRRVNAHTTEQLARAAVNAGVRRFVFLSSIKVNGEATFENPFTESHSPAPADAYGLSKLEAERKLIEISRETSLKSIVLRPPLVYGPKVKGNFLKLMQIVDRGLPLPLALIDNRRSFIYVENLIDAIISCMNAPTTSGNIYLVSDNDDISTPQLIRSIASALEVLPRLFPLPKPLLRFTGLLLGKSAEIARLTNSLQIDISHIQHELGWQPRYSLSDGLRDTVAWYRSETE